MPNVVSLRGRRNAIAKGAFSIEVIDLEVKQLIEATRIAVAPYSLADWMRREASPLMGYAIAERFGDDGGGSGVIGGAWEPLAESTVRIKEALGVPDPEAINVRSSQLVNAMVTDHAVSYDLLDHSAVMAIPGNISDPVLLRKLQTAREGHVQGSDEMMPGAVTPPRPVNVIDSIDVAMLMVSLEVHIMDTIATMMGSSLVTS